MTKAALKKAQPEKKPAKPKAAGDGEARAAAVAAQKSSICAQISVGTPLQVICRQDGMPAWRTVYDWMASDDDFAANIARARDLGADAIAEETLAIVDSEPERGNDGKIDSAWVAHQKLRAEHRLKLLAKWNPKKYGDKVSAELTGANGGAITQSIMVSFVSAPKVGDDE